MSNLNTAQYTRSLNINNEHQGPRWLGRPAVKAMDSWTTGNRTGNRTIRFPAAAAIALGWVTVFGQTTHATISPSNPGQLSLLPSAGREMSTSQSAVMLCGWRAKAGMAHSLHLRINVWVAGKTVEWGWTRFTKRIAYLPNSNADPISLQG